MNRGRALVFIAAIYLGGMLSSAQQSVAPPRISGDVASQGPSYEDTVKWIQNNINFAGTPPSVAQVLGGHATIKSNGTAYTVAFGGCSSLTLTETSSGSLTSADDPTNNDNNVNNIRYQVPLASIFSITKLDPNSPLAGADQQLGVTNRLTAGIAIAVKNGDASVSVDTTHSASDIPRFSGSPAPLTNNNVYPSTNVTADPTPEPIIVVQYTKPGSEDAPQHMVTALKHLVNICKNHPEQAPKSLF